MEYHIILGFSVIGLVALVGLPFGGLAQDLLWGIGDYGVSFCKLNSESEGLYDRCLEVNSSYLSLKPIFFIVGGIAGLIGGYKLSENFGLLDYN